MIEPDDYKDWMLLQDILPYIPAPITERQLRRWAEPVRDIGFPEPKRKLGKYSLYDKDEVVEWVILWMKISIKLGNKKLNGGRHE